MKKIFKEVRGMDYLDTWINKCTPCSSLLGPSMYHIGQEPLKRRAGCALIYPSSQITSRIAPLNDAKQGAISRSNNLVLYHGM